MSFASPRRATIGAMATLCSVLACPAVAAGPFAYIFPSGIEGVTVAGEEIKLYTVGDGGEPSSCPVVGKKITIISVDCGYATWTFQLIPSIPGGAQDIMVIGEGSEGAPVPGPLYLRCDVDVENLGYD